MDNFTLHILPGNPPPNFEFRQEYNDGYSFFKNTWERIFNRPNRPKLYDPMGFFRQSYVLQLSGKSGIVAQTLATHYNLKNIITEDLSFFENFLGIPIEYMQEHGCDSLLSFEYSAVGRDFSERKIGVNLYKVIIQQAINVAKTLYVDAVIGHPRRLTGTNDLIGETGCKCVVPNLMKYGVAVDVYVGIVHELVPYNDSKANFMSEIIWANRVDTTNITKGSPEKYHEQYFQPSALTLKKGA